LFEPKGKQVAGSLTNIIYVVTSRTLVWRNVCEENTAGIEEALSIEGKIILKRPFK
jgi:hypothetical protein